jgi:hypothetical protein
LYQMHQSWKNSKSGLTSNLSLEYGSAAFWNPLSGFGTPPKTI